MDTIIVEYFNETYFKLHCSYEQALELHSHFECYAENYWFSPKYKAKLWNGKISFFDLHDRTLPIGLFAMLKTFIRKFKYKHFFAFDKEEFVNELSENDITSFYNTIYKDSKYYPRDYQHEAIKRLLTLKRGVVESPTGSGKSLIIYSLIRYAMTESTGGKILLVVPNVDLTNQMFNDFEDYGWNDARSNVSVLYHDSGRYDPNKPILISTWQSIYKRDPSFFEQFEGVIVDEVHGAGSSGSIQTILKNSTNAEYRFGVTGTMPDALLDKYNIHGYIGPKVLEIETDKLIKEGHLSDIKIGNIFLQYPNSDVEENKGNTYQDECKYIINHKNRNKIFKYIINHINTNDNVLILCERLEHLDSIHGYLCDEFDSNAEDMKKGLCRPILKISGGVDPKIRQKMRDYMEDHGGVILVATYGTMSMGINIKRLHHVILGSSYKSKTKILQSIGRGLRVHATKKLLKVWDIIDDLRYVTTRRTLKENHIFKHFLKRLGYYKQRKFKYINKKINLMDL